MGGMACIFSRLHPAPGAAMPHTACTTLFKLRQLVIISDILPDSVPVLVITPVTRTRSHRYNMVTTTHLDPPADIVTINDSH